MYKRMEKPKSVESTGLQFRWVCSTVEWSYELAWSQASLSAVELLWPSSSRMGTIRLSLDIRLYFITKRVKRWHKNVSFYERSIRVDWLVESPVMQLVSQNSSWLGLFVVLRIYPQIIGKQPVQLCVFNQMLSYSHLIMIHLFGSSHFNSCFIVFTCISPSLKHYTWTVTPLRKHEAGKKLTNLICVEYLAMMKVGVRENPVDATTNWSQLCHWWLLNADTV